MDKNYMTICGDSFNVGIGLKNMPENRYSQLVCNKLNWDLLMLARGSSSNYTIHLQANYAAELEVKPKLVVISITSFDRIEWIVEGETCPYDVTLFNLNYHLYPPHHLPQPHHNPLPFHLQNNSNYKPILLSEQIGAFQDYFKHFKHYKGSDGYYNRLISEPDDKLELIENYYTKVWEHPIKRDYDLGLICSSYYTLKTKGINCIIIGTSAFSCISKLQKFIPIHDILEVDWGELSRKYPDSIGSHHCNETAHEIVAEKLHEKIIQNGYNL